MEELAGTLGIVLALREENRSVSRLLGGVYPEKKEHVRSGHPGLGRLEGCGERTESAEKEQGDPAAPLRGVLPGPSGRGCLQPVPGTIQRSSQLPYVADSGAGPAWDTTSLGKNRFRVIFQLFVRFYRYSR